MADKEDSTFKPDRLLDRFPVCICAGGFQRARDRNLHASRKPQSRSIFFERHSREGWAMSASRISMSPLNTHPPDQQAHMGGHEPLSIELRVPPSE
jgi:hypothetical protein